MSAEGWGFSSPLRSLGFGSVNCSTSSNASSSSNIAALDFPASVRALAWLSPVPEKGVGTGPDTRRAIEQVVSQLGSADAEVRESRVRVRSAQQVCSEAEAHKRVLQAQIEAAVEVATSAGSTPQNGSSVLAREMKTLIGRAQAVESALRDAQAALRAAEADTDLAVARLDELSNRKKSLEDKFMSFVTPSTPISRKTSRTTFDEAPGGRSRSGSGGGSSPLFGSTRDRRNSSPDSSGGERRISRSRLPEGTPHDREDASDASTISRASAQVALADPLLAYLECLRGGCDGKMARSQPPEGTPELSDEDRYGSTASTEQATELQTEGCSQSVFYDEQINEASEHDPHLVTLVISADAEPPLLSLAPLAHPEAQTPLTPSRSSSAQRGRVRIGDSVEFAKLQRSARRAGGLVAHSFAQGRSCKESSTMCVELDIRSKLGTVLREDGTVAAVKPGSQAAEAGVLEGWRITAVDGLCVSDEATFRKALAVAKKLASPAEGGDPTRTRWPFELSSPLPHAEEPCNASAAPTQLQEMPMDRFEWDRFEWVLVCEVDRTASAGFQCLDVVVGVNGTSLAGLSFDEASSALENAAAPLILTVLRVRHKSSSSDGSNGHGSLASREGGSSVSVSGGIGNGANDDQFNGSSNGNSSTIDSRKGFNDKIEDTIDDSDGNGSTGSGPSKEENFGHGNDGHIGEMGSNGTKSSGNNFAGSNDNVNSGNVQGSLPIERSQSLQRDVPGTNSEKSGVEVDADALAEPPWNSETDKFSEADVAAVTVMGFERGWALHALRATQRLSTGSSKVADDSMMSAADLDAAIEYIVDNVDTMDSLVALQRKAQAAHWFESSGTLHDGSGSRLTRSPNSLSSSDNAGESGSRRSSSSRSDLTAGQGAELATKMLKVGVALAAAASSAKVAVSANPVPSEVAAVPPPPAPPPAPAAAAAAVDPELQKYKKMLTMGIAPSAVAQKMVMDKVDPARLDLELPTAISADKAGGASKGAKAEAEGPQRRKLHWETIPEERLQRRDSIWGGPSGELLGGGGLKSDDPLHDFEELFVETAKETTNKANDTKKKAASKKAVALIDPQRTMNGSILLARVKTSPAEIGERVLRLDGQSFTTDQLEAIHQLVPTRKERASLERFRGDRASLTVCEQTMLALIAVPHASSRLEAMVFVRRFKESSTQVRDQSTTVQVACDQVQASDKLRRVFHIILLLGNRLNTTAPQSASSAAASEAATSDAAPPNNSNEASEASSAVQAFTLRSLLNLANTRAFDGKTSVLEYLVLVIERDDSTLLDFADDLHECVAAAARTASLEQAEQEQRRLDRGRAKVKEFVDAAKAEQVQWLANKSRPVAPEAEVKKKQPRKPMASQALQNLFAARSNPNAAPAAVPAPAESTLKVSEIDPEESIPLPEPPVRGDAGGVSIRPASSLLNEIKAGALLKPSRRSARARSSEGPPSAWMNDIRSAPGLRRAHSASMEEASNDDGEPSMANSTTLCRPSSPGATLSLTAELDESAALEELLKEAEQDIGLTLSSSISKCDLEDLIEAAPVSPLSFTPKPSSPSHWNSMESATASSAEEIELKPASEQAESQPASNPALAKYRKMLSMHLPLGAVQQKMAADGLDPRLLDESPIGPEVTHSSAPSPGDKDDVAIVSQGSSDAPAVSTTSSNPLLGEIHAAAARRKSKASEASNSSGQQPSHSSLRVTSSPMRADEDPYLNVAPLVTFLAEAETDAASTRKCLAAAKARYAEVLAYFCEDPDLSVHDFFSPLQEFFLAFKAAMTKIERRRAQEARAARGRSTIATGSANGKGGRPSFTITKKKPLSAAEAASREGALAIAETRK